MKSSQTPGRATATTEAKAIESQLQKDYGYSLEMKAGGRDPLADFFSHVKSGHCEYFSTAMAVMFAHSRIPARVVNGFLSGEYNEQPTPTPSTERCAFWVEVISRNSFLGPLLIRPDLPAGQNQWARALRTGREICRGA